MYEDRCCRETFCPVKGGLNRSTRSRNISWWTAGPGRVAPDVSSQLTRGFFLVAAHHHLTDYHQNQTHCYSCCIRIPSVASLAIDLLVLLAIQGRQRHRKGGTAHNRSTPPKAVPEAFSVFEEALSADLSARSAKKNFRMYF